MKFKKFLSVALSSLMVFQASFVCKAENEKVAKVVFFGPTESKKTSILYGLRNNDSCSGYIGPFQIEQHDTNLNCDLKLNCWDIGGKEMLECVVEANIGVLVLDASTDINTQPQDVENLLQIFRDRFKNNCPLLLVANKIDSVKDKETTKSDIITYATRLDISEENVLFTGAETGEGIDILSNKLFDIAKNLTSVLNNNSNYGNFLLYVREYPLPFWKTRKGQLAIGGAGSGLALLIGSGVYAYNKFKNRNQKIEKNNAVNRTKITPAKTQKLVSKK